MAAKPTIHIRSFNHKDSPLLWRLFFDAVHRTAAKDYSQEQLNAWAPYQNDLALWSEKMRQINPFIIECDQTIVGYADLQADGLIDHFFIAAAANRKGFGSLLMNHIIKTAQRRNISYLYAYVSLTAQPFFSRFGFQIELRQQVKLRNVLLTNARMGKYLNH